MKSSFFVDVGLLRRNPLFCHVFVARSISLLSLGMLAVAIPFQVYQLGGDSVSVGLAMALEGGGMFVGLLWGGVLADRRDRRGLILLARSACGLGFVGLALNAALPAPTLWAVYVLAVWDGFFGALGVTALLAAMPHIVGREQLMQARALSMLSMRLATVLSPALGGLLIAAQGVTFNYLVAALGTGLTLLPLLRLPVMRPAQPDHSHPLRALYAGVCYLGQNRVVLGVVLVGTLVTLTTGIRVLFPALAEAHGGSAATLGLMYSAVPLGATLGALTSGWAEGLRRPGLVMQLCGLGAFACLAGLGLVEQLALVLPLLAGFGYLVSIAGLLQYALVQRHTPDHYLGRVNGLWNAQEALGDSVATVGIGLLAAPLGALGSMAALGLGALALGLLALVGLPALRAPEGPSDPDPLPEGAVEETPALADAPGGP